MALIMLKSNFEVPYQTFGTAFNHVGQLDSEELDPIGEYAYACAVNRWVFCFFTVRRLNLNVRLRCGTTHRAPCSGSRLLQFDAQASLISPILPSTGHTTMDLEAATPMVP